jgi:predicted protein tyrosine phosphatase
MKLVVCALADLDRELDRHRPAGVVSLLSPGQIPPAIANGPPRLTLAFNDILAPADGLTTPSARMVTDLLAFAGRFPNDATLLLHCWMGISRSPAAAFVLACAREPGRSEAEIAAALRRAAPSATPNALFVRLADDHLGRGGRMSAAITSIGRGCEASSGQPFEVRA